MFTRKLTTQQKLLMLLVVCPLYLYCGSIICSALIKFMVLQLHITMDINFANVLLNFFLDLILAVISVIVLFDLVKDQVIDFFKNLKRNLFYGVIVGPCLMYGLAVIGGLISMFFVGTSQSVNQSTIETFINSHALLMGFTAVILAPIFEELLFRSTIFGWLYEVNPIFAHILSGFLFGFVHVMSSVLSGNFAELLQIFAYFFMGLALSFIYEKRNNIIVPIITHSLNNLISLIILFI